MASFYTKKDSKFFYIKYRKSDGSWADKSSCIDRYSPGSLRKIKQHVAEETAKELRQTPGQGRAWNTWVPQFLDRKYQHSPKTSKRMLNAWSALSTYLQAMNIIGPSEVTYHLCKEYPNWRTNPPNHLIKARSWNTALYEIKAFGLIMQECVRRGWIGANPCWRLGLKRHNTKVKPEISEEEQIKIETALETEKEWMRDSWLVSMRQGCRISETAVPMQNIDQNRGVMTFYGKGGKIHAAPIHPDLIPLIQKAKKEFRPTLVELPKYAPKLWCKFFKDLGMKHLSFHCTRVTVITRLARGGFNSQQTKAYVGHASETIHAIYQRLTAPDVAHLGAVLGKQPEKNQDAPSAIVKPNR